MLEGELLAPEVEAPPDFAPDTGGAVDVTAPYGKVSGADCRPFRLFHLVSERPSWEEGLSLRSLTAALSAAGVRQFAVTTTGSGLEPYFKELGITSFVLPFRRLIDFRSGAELGWALADFEPELVLAWGRKSLMRAARVPDSQGAYIATFLRPASVPKRLRMADLLIAEGRSLVMRAVRAGWQGDRLHYLPPLVESAIAPTAVCRAEIGTPDGRDVLISVGDLNPAAGFDTLIEALAGLDYCDLWLVGTGRDLPRLRRLARRFGLANRVRFLGGRTDLAELYAAADLAVVPARDDPVGKSVIEAWAQSKPLVATASEAAVRLIENDRTGRLVAFGGAGPLAKEIDGLLHDPLAFDRLALEGRKAFESSYGESRTASAWLSFLAWLTGRDDGLNAAMPDQRSARQISGSKADIEA